MTSFARQVSKCLHPVKGTRAIDDEQGVPERDFDAVVPAVVAGVPVSRIRAVDMRFDLVFEPVLAGVGIPGLRPKAPLFVILEDFVRIWRRNATGFGSSRISIGSACFPSEYFESSLTRQVTSTSYQPRS